MLVVDILVDLAKRDGMVSFMDQHSSYNQIFITKEDISKNSFEYLGF